MKRHGKRSHAYDLAPSVCQSLKTLQCHLYTPLRQINNFLLGVLGRLEGSRKALSISEAVEWYFLFSYHSGSWFGSCGRRVVGLNIERGAEG